MHYCMNSSKACYIRRNAGLCCCDGVGGGINAGDTSAKASEADACVTIMNMVREGGECGRETLMWG